MTREVRKTISFAELVDDVGLIKPFPVGGEHTVFFKIIGNVGKSPATSMERFFTNDPFSLIVRLHVLAGRVKHGYPVSVFYPDGEVGEIPIGLRVIGFSPDDQNTVHI
jgi:hypothetical protein